MLDVTVHNDRIYVGETFSVSFQRTLRIPEDGNVYPLPPGLGAFPIHSVVDYWDRVPPTWRSQNSYFISMYQREALWLGFDGAMWKPNAVKIAIGKVDAISGQAWDEALHSQPQNYIVCPNQPWLDGINAGERSVRQFVAMPLGSGVTVEAQITGAEEVGGIQLLVYEPKPGCFSDQPPEPQADSRGIALSLPINAEMGVGAGGKMHQKIYPDPYGVDTWDLATYGSIEVHIINSEQYRSLTGLEPHPTPVTAQSYTQYGLPWFALYDEEQGDLPAAEPLHRVKPIREQESEQGGVEEDEAIDIPESQIQKLHSPSSPS
ncbi:hypothetical protein IQ250_00270 [Pseudanabaenaceae cyanobacterium LEGE 13415]|nr:hypothetical protein [Pseudanabaenaceae cyanobacterium LEGE 13415]